MKIRFIRLIVYGVQQCLHIHNYPVPVLLSLWTRRIYTWTNNFVTNVTVTEYSGILLIWHNVTALLHKLKQGGTHIRAYFAWNLAILIIVYQASCYSVSMFRMRRGTSNYSKIQSASARTFNSDAPGDYVTCSCHCKIAILLVKKTFVLLNNYC